MEPAELERWNKKKRMLTSLLKLEKRDYRKLRLWYREKIRNNNNDNRDISDNDDNNIDNGGDNVN